MQAVLCRNLRTNGKWQQIFQWTMNIVKRIICVLFLSAMAVLPGCEQESPGTVAIPEPELLNQKVIVNRIEEVQGEVSLDEAGNVVAVDLAKDRSSATDDVLRETLKLPGLRRFRLAGGNITAETFAQIGRQNELEELFLQDLPLGDEEIMAGLKPLRKLKRLTLRRCAALTDRGFEELIELPSLRNLSLINANITSEGFRKIIEADKLAALDVRNCGQIQVADYRTLQHAGKLTDLKIGGFAVNDEVLDAIIPVKGLRGLTIEDSFVSTEAFKDFLEKSLSAKSLETLILNRNMAITDDALAELHRLGKLKRLTAGDMMISGVFLQRLAENETTRPRLEQLSLRKTLLRTESAQSLKNFPELRVLDLSGVAITSELARILVSLSSVEQFDTRDCLLDEETETILRSASQKP